VVTDISFLDTSMRFISQPAMNSMKKLGGFVRLMRPVNCIMMGFAVLVGAVLASSFGGLNYLSILAGFLTGFTLCAAAMVINDYYDRSIDAINEPSRPIPNGTVKTNEALIFMVLLCVVGFGFAFWVSIPCFVVAAVSLVTTGTYLTVGKRSGLPGNFLVSACVAIPFIYGSFVAIGTVGLNVVLFASMAFLSNTGREITKGIVDTKGDSAEGVKTLAVRFGEKKAAAAAAVFFCFCCGFDACYVVFGFGRGLVYSLCSSNRHRAYCLFSPFALGSFT
jgi:geranylgeranylglycerol-phosphate geranylgeranyltransferase